MEIIDGFEFYPELTMHERRKVRLQNAREKGRHSKFQWNTLHDIFGICVCCGVSVDELNGGRANKDHIVPIFIGGCDCIANLQPLCHQCNTHGVGFDLREERLPGWQTIYLHRMGAYY